MPHGIMGKKTRKKRQEKKDKINSVINKGRRLEASLTTRVGSGASFAHKRITYPNENDLNLTERKVK